MTWTRPPTVTIRSPLPPATTATTMRMKRTGLVAVPRPLRLVAVPRREERVRRARRSATRRRRRSLRKNPKNDGEEAKEGDSDVGQQQAPKDEEMGADGMGVAGGSAPPPAEDGRGKEKVQHEEKEEEATQSEKKDATSCGWEPSSSASDSSRSVTSSVHSAKTSGTTMDVLRAAARKGMEGLGHQYEEMVQRVIDMQMLAEEDPSKRPRVPFSKHITFCSTSFKRGWQLKRALPANLLSLWPWRQSLRLCLVVFDSDEAPELMGWIRQHCAAALEVDLLVVATSALPNGHWHASIAKNVAHKVAMETYLAESKTTADADQAAGCSAPQRPARANFVHTGLALDALFIMNLDGDNLLGPRYVDALCSLLPSVNADDSVGARRGAQGTTGRVGMWATHFIRMGGYDESYLPSGYQDVCLHQRVRHLGGSCRTILGEDLGLSVPNDLGNERVSLGPAKIANIDPYKKNIMSWREMNSLNLNDGDEKLKRGRWRRNMDDDATPPVSALCRKSP